MTSRTFAPLSDPGRGAREESLEKVAKNALREGPDAVSKITGLDIKTVKRLAKEPVSVV
jgi:hypothetical protein